MALKDRYTQGTIEYVPIQLSEALGRLTSLDSVSLKFDVYKDDDDETSVETNVSGENEGMLALCLIDTTDWDEGWYNIFLHFDVLPEQPRLGPFRILVD